MDVASKAPQRKTWLDLLVGVEAGIIGGVVMLIWFAVTAPLLGQPAWLIPNLLASRWFQDRALLMDPGAATYAGAALQLVCAGIAGGVNGLLTPGGRLFGLGIAALWYLLCYLFLWKRIAPLMLIHASQPILAAGYFLYGSALGWHHYLLARLRS